MMLQDILSKMEKQLINDIDHFVEKQFLINLVKKPKKSLYLLRCEKKIKNFKGKIVIFRFDWTDNYYT